MVTGAKVARELLSEKSASFEDRPTKATVFFAEELGLLHDFMPARETDADVTLQRKLITTTARNAVGCPEGSAADKSSRYLLEQMRLTKGKGLNATELIAQSNLCLSIVGACNYILISIELMDMR